VKGGGIPIGKPDAAVAAGAADGVFLGDVEALGEEFGQLFEQRLVA
jgi:hypothetical protein